MNSATVRFEERQKGEDFLATSRSAKYAIVGAVALAVAVAIPTYTNAFRGSNEGVCIDVDNDRFLPGVDFGNCADILEVPGLGS